jgi:exodeoxyribonuclease VII large subunit
LFENGRVQIYGVREITTYLRELLESNQLLGNVWIQGEVSNLSRPASGHSYFTLKDGNSQLRSVFFAQKFVSRGRTASLIENGNSITALGRIAIYEQRGDLQFIVDFVQPEGLGALQAEYERLYAQLDEEGLFDPARKRRLPRFPKRIGVVTSETGAVFHDICQVLARRWPLAEVVLSPTPVQGPDAIRGIIGALDQLNERGDIDVIIAGRGGGSIEELWAFNEELVARAIFRSVVPVVSAVGHETDVTIADAVADMRAPTPSAAAELVSPDRMDMLARLGVAAATLDSALTGRVHRERATLQGIEHVLERRRPDINRERQRIDDLTRRGEVAINEARTSRDHSVGNCVWRLKSLNPLATLERGFALVERKGAVVSSVAAVAAGDALSVRLHDGRFGAHVDGGKTSVQRRRTTRRIPDAQAPLFTMPEERA